jgi:hypothetical protein
MSRADSTAHISGRPHVFGQNFANVLRRALSSRHPYHPNSVTPAFSPTAARAQGLIFPRGRLVERTSDLWQPGLGSTSGNHPGILGDIVPEYLGPCYGERSGPS